MAPVIIDLGMGKNATLYGRGEFPDIRSPLDQQRRDTAEFTRSWPASSHDTHDAQKYIRLLNLLSYAPAGVLRSDPVAVMRTAVERGEVTVVIRRRVSELGDRRAGGTSGASQLTARPFPLSMRESSKLAAPRALIDKPVPDWAVSSDVTADELVSYLESIVGGGAANCADTFVDGSPTPLGDAEPFNLGSGFQTNDLLNLTARGVGETEEAECFAQYERDLELCNALASPMGGARGVALCKQQAFMNYQQCRGY